MITCEHCQQNLLPFVYDLMDDEEAQSLRFHLESCPDCQASLEKTREQQGILREAAKESYSGVRFDPPAEKVTAPQETPALSPRRRMPVRWAAAAALLFCVLGLGGYVGYNSWREHHDAWTLASAEHATAETIAAKHRQDAEARQEQLRKEIREINAQVDELLGNWKKDERKSRKIVEQHKTKVLIETPGSLQAGAKNEITINFLNEVPKGGEAPRPLRAQIVNADTREVLFEQPFKGADVHRITLPPDLPLKPGAKLNLVVEAQDASGAPIQIVDHLSLSAPEYLTHLYLDRPLYRPGETVMFRSLTLERFSLKPASELMQLRFRLLDPAGMMLQEMECSSQVVLPRTHEPVLGPDGVPIRGIATGEFTLPAFLVPGFYAVEVADSRNRFPSEKRSFSVETWETPLLLKELNFDRSSYGPGEKVQVHGKVRLANGSKAEKLDAFLNVTVDGDMVQQARVSVSADGDYRTTFQLPEGITQGVGSVSMEFHGPGINERISRPLPLVVNKLLVEFYPEGGNLIAGLPGRVYFQARTTQDKPADVAGEIIDSKGNVIVAAKSASDASEVGINQGMGVFELTPQRGERYRLRVKTPAKLDEKEFSLPGAKTEGLVLRVPQGVVKQDIEVELHSTRERELLVGAYCRGKLLDHAAVKVRTNDKTSVRLHAPPGVSGVYRITVFEKKKGGEGVAYQPLAERLIYSKGGEHLNIVTGIKNKTFEPGTHVNLEFSTHDEKTNLSPSIALLAVVDQSVMKLADDRTLRSMPLHFLVTSDIRRPEDLENADVFLGNHPRAAEALDLLLGVQGWRRFAEQDPRRFEETEHFASTKLLGGMATMARKSVDPAILALERQTERHAQTYLELQQKLAQSEKEEEALVDRRAEVQELEAKAQADARKVKEAEENLARLTLVSRRAAIGLGLFLLLLVSLFVVRTGILRSRRGAPSKRWFMAGTGMLLGLFILAITCGVYLMGEATNVPGGGETLANAPQVVEDVGAARPIEKSSATSTREGAKADPPSTGVSPLPTTVPDPAMRELGSKSPPIPMKELPAPGAAPTGPAPAPGLVPGMGFGGGGLPPKTTFIAPASPVHPASMPMPPSMAGGTPLGGGYGGVEKGPGGGGRGFGKPGFTTSPRAMAAKGGVSPFRGGHALAKQVGDAASARPVGDMAVPSGKSRSAQELRHEGRFDELFLMEVAREGLMPRAHEPSILREYAFKEKEGPSHQETILWRPVVVLRDGKGSASFDLPRRDATYHVLIFTHSEDGKLGSLAFEIFARGKEE